MLRILVADDMPLQVHMLEDGIRRMRPQDQVVTAQNGEEVLDIVARETVDLVLSDIRMPCMDGLEMLKRIGCVSPRTKVLFITGYALFEYAQQALRQGAVDFLVKPVEAAELKKKLDYWDERLSAEREKDRAIETEKLTHLVQQWLLTPAELLPTQAIRTLSGHLTEGWIAAAYMPKASGEEQLRQGIGAVLECGMALPQKPVFLSLPAERHLLFIVAVAPASKHAQFAEVMAHAAQRYGIRVGLSAYQSELVQAGFSAGCAARRGLDESFYACEPVGCGAPRDAQGNPEVARPDEIYRWLLCDAQDRARSLQSMLQGIRQARPNVSRLMEATVYNVARCAEKLGPEAAYRKTLADFAAGMREALHWDAYCRLLGECLDALAVQAERTIERAGDPVNQCILYLQRHYAQQISLEDMARRYYLTPNYFSALFKKRTNRRFVEYLTQLRLEKAAEQLRSTDDYVYTITARCGYLDERYFIRQFQKHYHMSPMAYRRMYRRE